jgi:hypothetical protein
MIGSQKARAVVGDSSSWFRYNATCCVFRAMPITILGNAITIPGPVDW